jgi:O-antigen ligase
MAGTHPGREEGMKQLAAYPTSFPFRTIMLMLMLSVGVALVTSEYMVMAIVPVLIIILAGLHSPGVIFYLLLFTVPLSVEIKLSQSLGSDFPDEFLMWLLTAILPIYLILKPSILRSIARHPLIIILVTGLFWTLITILYSEYPLLSIKYFLAKIWYIIPFCLGTILFLNNSKALRIAAICMVIPMIAAVLFILTRHAMLGFSFEKVNEIARPIFRNHVNYAALLVCMIPVSFALYRNSTGSRLFWMFSTILLLAGLFFSYSRGAWLALAAALITIPFVIKNKLQWLILIASTAIIASVLWLTAQNRYLDYRPIYEQTIYHSDFNKHIEATYTMRDLSSAERIYRWIAAMHMGKERLLTGYGPNSFYYEYKPYAVSAFATYVSDNQEHSTVHNYFLLLLTEQGLPGLLIFIVLFISMMMYAQRIYHSTADRKEKGLMLLLIALLSMIAMLIFLSDLIETDKIGSIFFICLGLLVGKRNGEKMESGV